MTKANNQRPDRGGNKKAGNVSTRLTAEEESILLAKELRLKPKSKQVLDLLIANPKMSQAEAYIRVHGTENRATARNEASKLMAKPSARIYSDRAVGKAKRRIVQLVDSDNEQVAYKASADILDRVEGKAIQKNVSTSTVVEVKLDLSGKRIGAHYVNSPTPPQLIP